MKLNYPFAIITLCFIILSSCKEKKDLVPFQEASASAGGVPGITQIIPGTTPTPTLITGTYKPVVGSTNSIEVIVRGTQPVYNEADKKLKYFVRLRYSVQNVIKYPNPPFRGNLYLYRYPTDQDSKEINLTFTPIKSVLTGADSAATFIGSVRFDNLSEFNLDSAEFINGSGFLPIREGNSSSSLPSPPSFDFAFRYPNGLTVFYPVLTPTLAKEK
jgi:hypothetical protein